MRAVDTNVLVRLITRDDQKQLAAATAAIKNGVWVSHVVLVETLWVLSDLYDRGHAALASVIEMLLGHAGVALQDRDVVAAALEQYRRTPAVGFSDCLILEIAKKSGNLPLLTFDKKLTRLEGTERL